MLHMAVVLREKLRKRSGEVSHLLWVPQCFIERLRNLDLQHISNCIQTFHSLNELFPKVVARPGFGRRPLGVPWVQLVFGLAEQSRLCTRATGYQPKLDEARLSVAWNELVCDLAVVDEVREGRWSTAKSVYQRKVTVQSMQRHTDSTSTAADVINSVSLY